VGTTAAGVKEVETGWADEYELYPEKEVVSTGMGAIEAGAIDAGVTVTVLGLVWIVGV
jgi:hypothetical protein